MCWLIGPQNSLMTCIKEMLVLCEPSSGPLMVHLPFPSSSVAHCPSYVNLQDLSHSWSSSKLSGFPFESPNSESTLVQSPDFPFSGIIGPPLSSFSSPQVHPHRHVDQIQTSSAYLSLQIWPWIPTWPSGHLCLSNEHLIEYIQMGTQGFSIRPSLLCKPRYRSHSALSPESFFYSQTSSICELCLLIQGHFLHPLFSICQPTYCSHCKNFPYGCPTPVLSPLGYYFQFQKKFLLFPTKSSPLVCSPD